MKKSFLISAIVCAVLILATGCSKQEDLAGIWTNPAGGTVSFDQKKSEVTFTDNGKKTVYTYSTRSEYRFLTTITGIHQFGMNYGSANSGQEFKLGSLWLENSNLLNFAFAKDVYTLHGGKGKSVESLDSRWYTTETPELFERLELDFDKQNSTFTLREISAESMFAEEDGSIFEASGTYRLESYTALVLEAKDGKTQTPGTGLEFSVSEDGSTIIINGLIYSKE